MSQFRQTHTPHSTTSFQQLSLRGSVRSQGQGHRLETQTNSTNNISTAPEATTGPPPLGTLHEVGGSAFNVDPSVPYLESGALEAAHAQRQNIPPASRNNRNIVGGFVSGLKRAMWGKQRYRDQINRDEPVPNTSSTSPEYRYASPTPPHQNMTPAPRTPAPMNIAPTSPVSTTPRHHYTGVSQTTMLPPPVQSPHSSSDTAHETPETTDTHGGTTIVEHQTLPAPMDIGSPVYVEPQPGSDYAKMDSPRHSGASFSSYMSRIHKFFHDINELPWVADRVTVDYFPGESRRRERPAQIRRPRHVQSWYNAHPIPASPPSDLFSASPPMVTFQFQHANDPPSNAPFAAVIYPSGNPAPGTPAAYGPARGLDHNTYPMAMVSSYPASAHQHQNSAPVYPHGYVSHQQEGAATAQYPGLSVHAPQTRA